MGLLARVRAAATSLLAVPGAPIRGSGGWWPIVREPYSGAWQRNDDIRADSVLRHTAVFACTTLIATDIGKCRLRLVEQDEDGIWHETQNAAWNPVLRKPNRFQTFQKFAEQWITSKVLAGGNAYVLKQRDNRNVVSAMYVLDPARVTPLVTPSGDVYYELKRDDLAGLPEAPDGMPFIVPASEIIHDPMVCLFHPLIGVSPLYAAAAPALQGLQIQDSSTQFFSNGSQPGGVLTAPGEITDDIAKQMKDYWSTEFTGTNAGKIAVLGGGLTYTPMGLSAAESQLVDQIKWTTETICSAYHVPPFLITGEAPPYGNIEPLLQQYYGQCLQSLMTAFESALDEGLELPKPYGTEFDIDDLIWMDTATKTEAASKAVGSGTVSPNEARKKYFGLGPVPGGESPYMQQQQYSLAALAARDADQPFSKPTQAPAPPMAPDDAEAEDDEATITAAFMAKNWKAVA